MNAVAKFSERWEVTDAGRAALADPSPAPQCDFRAGFTHCPFEVIGTVRLSFTDFYCCAAHAGIVGGKVTPL